MRLNELTGRVTLLVERTFLPATFVVLAVVSACAKASDSDKEERSDAAGASDERRAIPARLPASKLDAIRLRFGHDDVAVVEWLDHLARERSAKIDWLREYRLAGQFPYYKRTPNDVPDGWTAFESGHPIFAGDSFVRSPIFVDAGGTTSAVTNLMLRDGEKELVEQTAKANNKLVLSDVVDGPIYDWILSSGLTQAECTVIQPRHVWWNDVQEFDVEAVIGPRRPEPEWPADKPRDPRAEADYAQERAWALMMDRSDRFEDRRSIENGAIASHLELVENKLRLDAEASLESALRTLLPRIRAERGQPELDFLVLRGATAGATLGHALSNANAYAIEYRTVALPRGLDGIREAAPDALRRQTTTWTRVAPGASFAPFAPVRDGVVLVEWRRAENSNSR